MKKRIIFVIATCMLVFSGCTKINEPIVAPDDSHLAETTLIEDDVFSEETDDTTTMKDVITDESVSMSDSVSDEISYQKYYEYMLSQSSDDNIMFSPESLNIAFAIHSELLDDENKALFQSFLANRDYLHYQGNDTFKIVNRLWINENCDFHVPYGYLMDIAYLQDMTDSEKATKIKNDYVAEQTDNFITSTPTIFDSQTVCDSMNVIYFKDTWLGGDKILDDFTSEFRNNDGSISNVYMFNDEKDYIYKADNATAYSMVYNDNFIITIVLPDEGYSVDDINIDDFIHESTDGYTETKVYAKIPEFESKSEFKSRFTDFGLPLQPALANGITNESLDPPLITQVARIRVDHEGTEAAAVSEVVVTKNAIAPMTEEPYYFTVNRPFAYFISDTLNNDVAFIGVIKNLNS